MTFEGRICIVTGAAGRVGSAICAGIAERGAHGLAVDLREPDELPEGFQFVCADLSQRADCEKVAHAAAELGGVDILVNGAQTWRQTPVDADWQASVDGYHAIMRTNLLGVVMLSRLCVPLMRARGGGDIVNLTSSDVLPAKDGGTNPADTDVYNASRWAINGLTDAWAKALAKDQIRVNGLCLGTRDAGVAALLIALIEDGRTGENIGAYDGEPLVLPVRAAANRRISG